MKNYKLEIIVFMSGIVVMILELTGSRILAPYMGTSLLVWTSLIGIILGSLSLGYYLGGKIADKKACYQQFSLIIFLAAIFIAITSFSKDLLLEFLQKNIADIRIGSTIATTLLFAPASIFLGMVSPYAVKLKLDSLQKSGRTVGNLYAISTIGSIVGTFLAGFVLLSLFGNTKLLIILAIILLLNSILAFTSFKTKNKIFVTALLIGYLANTYVTEDPANAKIIDVNTNYNRVQIYDTVDTDTKKNIRILDIATTQNSAMFLDNTDDLVFEYTKFYDLASHFNPNFKNTLILGGGAYSYPKYFLKKFPDATMDVVEIDPGLTKLAKEYFNLKDNPRLKIYHQDGRTFLNNNEEKYDVIYGDAFNSFYSIPYQLTTSEAVEKIYNSLSENGVVLINIISSIEGPVGKFFRAEYKTYKEIFPEVYVFPVRHPENSYVIQNILLVGYKGKTPQFSSKNPRINKYLNHLYAKEIEEDLPVLTDNFAPVDQYMLEIF